MPVTPDVDQVVSDIIRWASIESPTYDAAAVNLMMDEGARDLGILGFDIERIPASRASATSSSAALPAPSRDLAC